MHRQILERSGPSVVSRSACLVTALAFSAVLARGAAWAGPPFLTDDPEPVELGHWEFYVASQWSFGGTSTSGTLPHLEVNYGALPNLQLHVILPAVIAWQTGQAAEYGPGDIELGAKFRFIEEGTRRPQVGTFPLVLLPTGSEARGLGTGKTQFFLPIWIQKSFGPWMTYGGSGLRLISGERDVVAGWLLQRELATELSIGTEAFWTVPTNGASTELQINLGVIVNLGELHHLLLSAGPAFGGGARAQAYAAYQLTI
jgi:hypothetical protein